jgi:hypothetical protein
MKKKLHILFIMLLVSYCSFSQGVGIGTTKPDASAALDVTATGKGFLPPRMSTTAIHAIIHPARGLMVYDSTANQLMINRGTPTAPNWEPVTAISNLKPVPTDSLWSLNGNNGTNPVIHFVGTKDNQPLHFRVNNVQVGELHPATGNIFWGLRAGESTTTGFNNIAIGTDALKSNTNIANLVAIGDSALFNNGLGSIFSFEAVSNTGIGSKALFANTRGRQNTAVGSRSLFANTIGVSNTAIGSQSLFSNTTGFDNTAIGVLSLFSNTIGSDNIAIGLQSLSSNTTGSNNTAIGVLSLFSNTTGRFNTATGRSSLDQNTTGEVNSAYGDNSLFANTTGTRNTAVGSQALGFNTIGSNNTAVGVEALIRNISSQFNTAVGFNAADGFEMGFNNTIIGANADVNQAGLFNCVALGESATCTASSQVRLGNTFTTSIGGFVGYSNLSDGRFKKNIKETVKGIDFIMKLRPVMYQFDMEGLNQKLYPGKKMDELSSKAVKENGKTVFSGFVAQEVEQAAKDAGYDFSGVDKPKNENDMYGLRYAEFVVPLVKAMQEQQQQIEGLKKQNDASQQIITELRKRLDDLEKKVK